MKYLLTLIIGLVSLLNAQQFPPLLVPIIELEGTIPGERLDWVAAMGDINHDGFDDVLASHIENGIGKAMIYLGDINPDLVPDFILEGGGKARAGDFNMNGENDIVTQLPGIEWILGIYLDLFITDTIADFIIKMPPDPFNGIFGILVSDITGDGFDDLIVSEANYSFPAGRVLIYTGNATGIDTLPTCTIIGDNNLNKNLGKSLATGDVSGDGEPDLVVHGRGGSQGDKGYINIYYGGSAFDTIPDFRLGGTSNSNFTPNSDALCVMDINGDSTDDIGIMRSNTKFGAYYGGTDLDTIPDFIFTSPDPGIVLAHPANAGDTNGDGYDDIVFGSPGSFGAGVILLYHCGNQLDNIADGGIGGFAWTNFGLTVTGAGRFDGDDRDDIVAGGPGDGIINRRGMFGVYKDTTTTMVGIHDPEAQTIIPELFELHASYPNPFNNHTIIPYELSQSAHVELSIYNSLGQEIKTLATGMVAAGKHAAEWDGRDNNGNSVASGVYIYQMKVNGDIKNRQMRFIK